MKWKDYKAKEISTKHCCRTNTLDTTVNTKDVAEK